MDLFRKRLRERSDWAKANLGLTQEQQAQKIDVSRERLRGWFGVGREPSIELLADLCRKLETHPNWLLGFDDNPIPPDKREPGLTEKVEDLINKLSKNQTP